jgi:3-dehydroquinate dehydratase/shikimate dehydrogenase
LSRICLCLTGKTLQRNLETLAKYRKFVDLAELRVDCLEDDERLYIRRFPALAGLPVMLSIRRRMDGGYYTGGEGARTILFAKALAFAEADRRKNFAYMDLEEDFDVPSLEEAARTFGTRIIRSSYSAAGVNGNLGEKLAQLRRVGDEIVKVTLMPRSLEEVIRVWETARKTPGVDKILVCQGPLGIHTRILAKKMGNFLSFAGLWDEPDLLPAAPGQVDPQEMAELYRFRNITEKTRVFGITGFPLQEVGSHEKDSRLRFFNTVFALENLDAVYVPFPADSVISMFRLGELIGVSCLSVTAPFQEAVIPSLSYKSQEVTFMGACNTLVAAPLGWQGYNTNAAGFRDSLLAWIGRPHLKRLRITIIGAGGAARAVASEVYRLGGKALILNRSPLKARDLAKPYRFAWGGLDMQSSSLIGDYGDLIIQATSLGMESAAPGDPLEFYKFSGKERVMDLIYPPEKTSFLRRAELAGCPVLSGHDLFLRQARYQYRYFVGKEFPSSLLAKTDF